MPRIRKYVFKEGRNDNRSMKMNHEVMQVDALITQTEQRRVKDLSSVFNAGGLECPSQIHDVDGTCQETGRRREART